MSKHTPGPWHCDMKWDNWNQQKLEPVLNIEGADRMVAFAFSEESTWEGAKADKTADANARLIAAAPELLEACRNMLAVLTEPGIQDVDLWKADKRSAELSAYDAIAKATGEQATA